MNMQITKDRENGYARLPNIDGIRKYLNLKAMSSIIKLHKSYQKIIP